ncbi:MAG: hydrogenase maturation protease [Anaerolineales bacterium]
MRTLVLGLGNPILRDDSIGLRVAQELRGQFDGNPDIEVSEDYWGGLRLMERMIGFDRVIIIDAILADSEPGTIHLLSPDDIPTQRSASAHDVNLPTALEFGRRAGAQLPPASEITLIGIEAADVQTFDESLTPELECALPHAVEAVLSAMKRKRVKA